MMATYKQISAWVKQNYGFTIKTCWIADMKEKSGLKVKQAWNRRSTERLYPCPVEKAESILSAFRKFGMIK